MSVLSRSWTRRPIVAAHGAVLSTASTLVGATVLTSGLGYLFWGVAARQFPPAAVGAASAAISAMMLLGTLGMLGLGTLLIGELPRQAGREGPLVVAALSAAGVAGAALGALWALVAPAISVELVPLGGGPLGVALFALGAGLTAIVLVLDQALLGMLRGGLQLLRNGAFGVAKLGLLVVAGLSLTDRQAPAVFAVWQMGNIISLLALGACALRGRPLPAVSRPRWDRLRHLPRAAVGHHLLNLSLQLSHLALPVLVTALLTATVNAYFYMAWMIGGFVFVIPVALTMGVYAVGTREPAALAQKVRFSLWLSGGLGVLANVFLFVGARPLLGIFGPAYADQAAWCLRILALGVFPLIVKDHYVAVCRVEGRIGRAAAFAAAGAVLELGAATIGALNGGLSGLSTAWLLALCLEALLLVGPVSRAAGWRWASLRLPRQAVVAGGRG